MRSDDCQSFRVEIGHVHSITNGSFEQRRPNGLCNLNADALLCFDRGCAKVRRENKIGRAAQWRIGWQRFDFENIQRRTRDVPILQRLSQRSFINQTAARAVDDPHAAFCLFQTRRIENVARLGGEWRVKLDEIGAQKQIVQFVHEFDLQTASACH